MKGEHPPEASLPVQVDRPAVSKPVRIFALSVLLLAVCFAKPLFDLTQFAFATELYSHTLLVPVISLFLVWRGRQFLPVHPVRPSPAAAVPLLLGLGLIVGYGVARKHGVEFLPADYLAISLYSFVCWVIGFGLLALGPQAVRALAFPFGFLFFLAPFPVTVTHALEVFFQHTSADASNLLFHFSGTKFLREGLVFKFSGLNIEVAEECSGLRSSLVLFITSLLGGHLLLNHPWKRVVLVVAVIPLAIVRNAVRIVTIVLLTLHVNPQAIHSPIHHQGGPIFFMLSLIPFFFLLAWLRRTPRASPRHGTADAGSSP